MRERGPRHIQRTFGGENAGLERRHGATGIAEAHHQPAHRETIERAGPRFLADRIVDNGNTLPTGQFTQFLGPLAIVRAEHVVAAIFLGERNFRVRSHCADNRRAEMFRPLARDEAHSARRGMEQDRFSALQRMRALEEILGRHAFEQ